MVGDLDYDQSAPLGWLRAALAGRHRAFVNIGHRAGPIPYKAVAVARMAELGPVKEVQLGNGAGAAAAGVVYIVDLTAAPTAPPPTSILNTQPHNCIRLG